LRPDIAPDARALAGVEVIDLHTAAARGGEHLDSVSQAESLVLEAAAEFDDRLVDRRLDPAVVALRAHVETAVARELDRLRPKVSAEVAAEFDQAAHRLARSILHTPTIRARTLARTGSGEDYLRALHTLFGIDVGSV
jgi:glutamyl-tRNA reductase